MSNQTSKPMSICNVGGAVCDLSIVPVGLVHLEPGERWTDSRSMNEIERLRAALLDARILLEQQFSGSLDYLRSEGQGHTYLGRMVRVFDAALAGAADETTGEQK